MGTDDLLAELVAWGEKASVGDNGEEPTFTLDWQNDRWGATASSFYDGHGDGKGDTPTEALQACLDDLRSVPAKRDEQERSWIRRAVARQLRVSYAEAEVRLRCMEGWAG